MSLPDRKASRLRTLLSIAYELGKARPTMEIAGILARAAREVSGAEGAAVVLLGPRAPASGHGDGSFVAARDGTFPPPLEGDSWLTHGAAARERSGTLDRDELASLVGASPAVDVLAVPLTSQAGRVGTLACVSPPGGMDDEGTAGLSVLAQHASLALAAAQALADVRLERNKLKSVLDHMNDGLILAEAAGIAYVAPRAAALLSPDAPGVGDSLPACLEELSGRCDPPVSITALMHEAASQTNGRPTAEVRLGPPARRELRLRLFSIPADPDRPLTGLLVSDITREREAERLRAEFLRNVSHELRTPLASIMAYSETLLTFGGKSDGPPPEEFLRTILEQSQRLDRLIGNILAYSRSEAGALQLSPETLDAVAEAARAIRVIEPQARAAHVRLEGPEPAAGAEVRADREALQQILLNLLSNAVKYNRPGGFVRISVGREGESVAIRVEDSGIGLAPEERLRVFERFYRAPSVKAHIAGTGIGLSLVKSLVETMGGRVEVASAPGDGSIFRAVLPAAESPPALSAAA